jgi:hypothetical protein
MIGGEKNDGLRPLVQLILGWSLFPMYKHVFSVKFSEKIVCTQFSSSNYVYYILFSEVVLFERLNIPPSNHKNTPTSSFSNSNQIAAPSEEKGYNNANYFHLWLMSTTLRIKPLLPAFKFLNPNT